MAGAGIATRDSQLLHTLSNGLAELYLPDGGDFPGRVIRLVSSLVPAESCSYNHLVGPVAVAWQIEPADALDFPDAAQLFQQHLPEHPILQYYEAPGDLAARRISDAASDRQFRAAQRLRVIAASYAGPDASQVLHAVPERIQLMLDWIRRRPRRATRGWRTSCRWASPAARPSRWPA